MGILGGRVSLSAIALASVFLILDTNLANATTANNKSCTTVDLRSEMLGENYNQGETGWCYAYAVSDMLSQAMGQRLSPIVIGAIAASQQGSLFEFAKRIAGIKKFDGAFVSTATYIAAKKGLCLQADEKKWVKDAGVEGVYNKLYSTQLSGADVCEHPLGSFRASVEINGPGVVNGTYDDLQPALDWALDHNQISVIEYDPERIIHSKSTMFPTHASSVVGRRRSGSECQYLVRNSWGSQCQFRSDIDCKNGNFWLGQKDLRRAVDAVISLRELKKR